MSESLASILKKIDEGEGTLGSLVNNPEIYQSLKAVVESLERGKLAKWYLRRNVKKKAEEAWEEEEGGASP